MTYVTVTIDTEEEWDWSGPFPVHDFSVDNISALPEFQTLCTRYGIRPTYFVNHAVLDQMHSRSMIARLARTPGVEVGMHLHPWNTPPIDTLLPSTFESFTENLPIHLIREKLRATLELLQSLGVRPRSYRGGRYSSGPEVQEFLAENGFLVDASICPYTTWRDEGAPDYSDRGLDIRESLLSQGRSLWEVPLTRAFTRQPYPSYARLFRFLEGSPLRHFRVIGILERLRLIERVWLNFECEDEGRLLRFLQVAQRHGLPHLCLTVHSSSLAPGPGPYCRTVEQKQKIFQTIERVFAAIARDDALVPVTMTELAQTFEERHESPRYQPVG